MSLALCLACYKLHALSTASPVCPLCRRVPERLSAAEQERIMDGWVELRNERPGAYVHACLAVRERAGPPGEPVPKPAPTVCVPPLTRSASARSPSPAPVENTP